MVRSKSTGAVAGELESTTSGIGTSSIGTIGDPSGCISNGATGDNCRGVWDGVTMSMSDDDDDGSRRWYRKLESPLYPIDVCNRKLS